MEDLYPYVGVQYGTTADNPGHALLPAAGLSIHIRSEICVTGRGFFFSIIRGSDAFGLIAASEEHFRNYRKYTQDL